MCLITVEQESKIGDYIAFKSNSGFLETKQNLLKTPNHYYVCTFVTSYTFGWIAESHFYSNSCITSQSILLFVLCLLLTFLALILWMSLSNPNVTVGRIGTFTDEAKPRIRLLTVKEKRTMIQKVRSLNFDLQTNYLSPMTLTGLLSVTVIASGWNTQ